MKLIVLLSEKSLVRRCVLALALLVCCSNGFSSTFYVLNNQNAGPGSLRQAIQDANADPNAPHLITFSGYSVAPTTITLVGNTLPPFEYTTVVDATSHPGYSGSPSIRIDGSQLQPNGSGSNVYGDPNLIIFSFSGPQVSGSGVKGFEFIDDPANADIIPVEFHKTANFYVLNNRMTDVSDGVAIIESTQGMVSNNTMNGNSHGVYVDLDCQGTVIEENTILQSNAPSIYVAGSNTIIRENNISGSLERIGILIEMKSSPFGTGENNLVIRNHLSGVSYGVAVYKTLSGTNNGQTQGARYNLITENTIINVQAKAIFLQYGAAQNGFGNESKPLPTISVALSHGLVEGSANSGDRIEVFGSNGPQEAAEYLGTVYAGQNGGWSIDVGQINWTYVTATATDPDGTNAPYFENTSELGNLPVEPVLDTCRNCISSFAPLPGKEYVITAWVKEKNAPRTKTSYDLPYVQVHFQDAGGGALPSSQILNPSGRIVDGWQRLVGKFTVPAGAAYLDVELSSTGGKVLFDDIRVHPFDGSMVTYVYDPVSMRLVAQLDERNYSTIYEYDEEGRLTRVKKETERGVETIQETTTSTVKREQ